MLVLLLSLGPVPIGVDRRVEVLYFVGCYRSQSLYSSYLTLREAAGEIIQ